MGVASRYRHQLVDGHEQHRPGGKSEEMGVEGGRGADGKKADDGAQGLVPRDRVEEIAGRIKRAHPSAEPEGTEPRVPAFP